MKTFVRGCVLHSLVLGTRLGRKANEERMSTKERDSMYIEAGIGWLCLL